MRSSERFAYNKTSFWASVLSCGHQVCLLRLRRRKVQWKRSRVSPKTNQMFSVPPVILDVRLRKIWTRNHMIIKTTSLWKSSVFILFPSTWKRKAGDFKFLRFEERFRKAPFAWRVSVDVRPNLKIKAAVLNFSGLVWTLAKLNCTLSSTFPRQFTNSWMMHSKNKKV